MHFNAYLISTAWPHHNDYEMDYKNYRTSFEIFCLDVSTEHLDMNYKRRMHVTAMGIFYLDISIDPA